MKPEIPQGTRAEKVAFARNLYRQQQLGTSKVRMPRSRRRWVVAGLAAVIALTVAGQLVVGLKIFPENKALGLLWALLGFQAMFFVVLMYAVGNLTKLGEVLDERERAQRDRAMAIAYRILILATIPAAVVFLIAGAMHVVLVPTAQVGAPAYVGESVWFVLTLPLAVMAWTLPDPEPEPEAEA